MAAAIAPSPRKRRNPDATLVIAGCRAYRASRNWYGNWRASSGPLDPDGRPDLTVTWQEHGTYLSRTHAEEALAALPELAAILAEAA